MNDNAPEQPVATHTLMLAFEAGGSAGLHLAVQTGEAPSITELERGPALSYGFPLTQTSQLPDGRVLFTITGPDEDANKNDDPEFRDLFKGDAKLEMWRHAKPTEDLGAEDDTMISVLTGKPVTVVDGLKTPHFGILIEPGKDEVKVLSRFDFETTHADLLLHAGKPTQGPAGQPAAPTPPKRT